MMNTVTRTDILFFFSVVWLFFLSVQDAPFHDSYLYTVLSLVCILIIPGLLTTMILRLRGLDVVTYLCLALGFSILEIMLVGLIGNEFLRFIGVERPLDREVLISQFSIFIAALIALAWLRVEKLTFTLHRYFWTDSRQNAVLAAIPLALIALAIFGANLLNNGGSGVLTLALLVAAAIYAAVLLYYSRELDDTTIAIALFGLSLSLLLMTSLRGFYVTGHDIQREFEVFQLTKQSGLWAISHLRDAYNACLSITIFPTVLSALSNSADPYIYKVVFQVLFATVPPILFLFVRRYTTATIALIAALYFVSFPTFFMDMPFLNRQEIAFVFLFLMFLVMSLERLSLAMRRILFVVFGLGMVLSHYSTTYTVVALLLVVTLGRPLFVRVADYLARFKLFAHSGIAALRREDRPPKVTIVMTFLIMGMSFVWSSILTDTSNNSISRVVSQTIEVIVNPDKDGARSGDVAYGLFAGNRREPAELLREYSEKIATALRARDPDGTYFSDQVLASYAILPAMKHQMPLTSLGQRLEVAGVDVAILNSVIRESSAKLLQLFMIFGMGAALFTRRHLIRALDSEYVLFALGSLAMLVAIIVLPVLSAEYGLLRAFQQSLLFLGIFIALGNVTLLTKAGTKTAVSSAAALAVLFFLSSTGVMTQMLGGYEAQLHLNNDGTYYDLYYMRRGDIVGTEWLLTEMQKRSIYGYQSGLATDVVPFISRGLSDGVEVFKNIYPPLIRTRSYVLVDSSTLVSGRASVIYQSDVLGYTYPVNFLDENKNLIYSNGDVAIYR
ncbi:MAG: DUF2206 domain-containing protein [Patescibacteria group bacterium]